MRLAIDTHSTAYLLGRIFGQLLILAVGVVLVGVFTRKWRNPVALGLEDLPRVTALRKKRRRLLAAIVAAACALVATDFVLDLQGDTPYGPAAATGPTDRTVDAPDTVAGYRLITGEAAAQLAARLNGRTSDHFWFYSNTPGGTRPSIMFSASTNAWNPQGAAEKSQHSMDWLFLNFFAGAKVDDAKDVDPGPLGGLMRCGHPKNGRVVICHWEDAATAGSISSFDGTDLQQVSALALQFRNAAEH